MKYLRPSYGNSAFTWVHIADDGNEPLCGESYNERYELHVEEGGNPKVCKKCQGLHDGYTVETLTSGQARAYADSVYTYKIVDTSGAQRPSDEVLAWCQKHVKMSYRKPDMPGWHSPRLVTFRNTGFGEWLYKVTEAFTG